MEVLPDLTGRVLEPAAGRKVPARIRRALIRGMAPAGPRDPRTCRIAGRL